jgi:hypothetical protein
MESWMHPVDLEREELALVCNSLGLIETAVEVGVHQGEFAQKFLALWDGKTYYAVDPWQDNLPGYVDPIIPPMNRENDYLEFLEKLKEIRESNRVEIFRTTSLEAVELFRPDSIDFVYIDANHNESAVITDIKAWYNRVKVGGILAGHDIINGDLTGVRNAVFQTLPAAYHPINVMGGDAWSWYIRKQELSL